MGTYFNVAPKLVIKERTGKKIHRYVPEQKDIHIDQQIVVAPESNLQWPDGYMYNETLLYNWKIW